jgi:GT2 family glycosyltransferase
MDSTISVCICTRNRPDELRRCLNSLRASSVAVAQTVVSDDSTDSRTEAILSSEYPWVRYVVGPRTGLAANRNHALEQTTGSHVLFLDDDACLGADFLRETLAVLAPEQGEIDADRVIVSGVENNYGHLVFAHDQSFLGHQQVAYAVGQALRTIVINSTLFPRALFDRIRFDRNLVYGYDEVDIATQALGAGYIILGCRTAVNFHFPSTINRDYYRPHTEASRLYVTFKRYARYERKPLKASAFAVVAPAHLVAHALRRGGAAAVVDAFRTIGRATRLMRSHLTAA